MPASSLWLRTATAFLWGLVLSVSLILNVNYLMPFPAAVKLFIGLLLAFLVWAIVMTYCLCRSTAIKASVSCAKVLLISAAVNVASILM